MIPRGWSILWMDKLSSPLWSLMRKAPMSSWRTACEHTAGDCTWNQNEDSLSLYPLLLTSSQSGGNWNSCTINWRNGGRRLITIKPFYDQTIYFAKNYFYINVHFFLYWIGAYEFSCLTYRCKTLHQMIHNAIYCGLHEWTLLRFFYKMYIHVKTAQNKVYVCF